MSAKHTLRYRHQTRTRNPAQQSVACTSTYFRLSTQMWKAGACQHTKPRIVAPVFGFYFVMYVVQNKMALETLFFLRYFNEYSCFFLSSAPHHSSTLAFPFPTSHTILPRLLAAFLISSPLNLIFIMQVSGSSDCADSNSRAIGE